MACVSPGMRFVGRGGRFLSALVRGLSSRFSRLRRSLNLRGSRRDWSLLRRGRGVLLERLDFLDLPRSALRDLDFLFLRSSFSVLALLPEDPRARRRDLDAFRSRGRSLLESLFLVDFLRLLREPPEAALLSRLRCEESFFLLADSDGRCLAFCASILAFSSAA